MTQCSNCEKDLARDFWREYYHIETGRYSCDLRYIAMAEPRRERVQAITRAKPSNSGIPSGTQSGKDDGNVPVGVRPRNSRQRQRLRTNFASRSMRRQSAPGLTESKDKS